MAHFRATVQGNRSEASRLGTAKSGLRVTANGWDVGIKVYASVDSSGADILQVVATGGSNGGRSEVELVRIVDCPGAKRAIVYPSDFTRGKLDDATEKAFGYSVGAFGA